MHETQGWTRPHKVPAVSEMLCMSSCKITLSPPTQTKPLDPSAHPTRTPSNYFLWVQGDSGRVQLDEEAQDLTRCSIETLCHMLHVPAAAADIIKADLAGLMLQILQGSSFESFHLTAANFLYLFSCQPAGRQLLLEMLTPDSAKPIIDLSLELLEAPDYNHSDLAIATGECPLQFAVLQLQHDATYMWDKTSIMIHSTDGEPKARSWI